MGLEGPDVHKLTGLGPLRPGMKPPVAAPRPKEVVTPRGPIIDDLHGWRDDSLRDGTGTNPEVIELLEAENKFADQIMARTVALQSVIAGEIKGRLQLDDQTVPIQKGDYLYYRRIEATQNYWMHCRRFNSMAAPEEVILDENVLAQGFEIMDVGQVQVSPDGRLLAYAVNHDGKTVYSLHIRDLATGQDFPEQIGETSGDIAWANDNSTIYYCKVDDTDRPFRVMRHTLGSDPNSNSLLFVENDAEFAVDLHGSLSDRFLIVGSESSDSSEVFVLDLNDPSAQLRSVAGRTSEVRYYVTDHEDEFFILTDADGAENFKVVRAPITNSGRENWRDFVAYEHSTKIENIETFRDHLVVTERNQGLLRVRVRKLSSNDDHLVTFPESTFTVEVISKPDYQGNSILIDYTSMVTPGSVFDYNLDTRAMVVKKEVQIPSGYDPSLYASQRITATATDGTLVPISVVYKKATLERPQIRPCLLWGYGAYGATIDPYFSRANLSLLDRGFVFAVAHPRGGGDLGEPWRDAGRLLNKKNTFTDFISCTEHLIKGGFATPGYIAMEGRSAGGLMVGAVLNARPDLYKAAFAGKPFVDVRSTMLDASLPLTEGEWNEWGNPNLQPFYDYINSYSPNDNVRAQDYPHVLLTSGLHDNQVGYWEALKFAQRLRRANTADTFVILKTIMTGGHHGFTGRLDSIDEQAFERAFILAALELDQAVPTPSA